MIIKKIELKNFRNYENLNIEFDKKTNILYGKNAQGKTNLLEAAYISATTKSYKGIKDSDLIKIGEKEAHICTKIENEDEEYSIDFHIRTGKPKGIAINKIPQKRASDIFGKVQVVFFSPEDLEILKRGPEKRRRFLDMELSQIDKVYLNDLATYKKTIAQRNKLLKDIEFEHSLIDTLSVWDDKLIKYGSKIIKKRRNFIANLKEIVSSKYYKISHENIEMDYEPNVEEDDFSEILIKKRWEEIHLGQTTVGPHRDDISFEINGLDARKYGSQGQQRSAALSLKLAEIDIIKEKRGQNPILLLDDVLSELDTERQKELLKSINDVQTIITCTGMEEIKEAGLEIGKVFIVENGRING